MILITVSTGSAGDNVSVSELSEDLADSTRPVTETELPHLVSVRIRITEAYSIPQCRSRECCYTCGNGCRGASHLEISSFQNTLDSLCLLWDKTSPKQGYSDPSVDYTLLQDEEDDEEEEYETSHNE